MGGLSVKAKSKGKNYITKERSQERLDVGQATIIDVY